MTEDDGTQQFGELRENNVPTWFSQHWDTPDWWAEMKAKYGDGRSIANAA